MAIRFGSEITGDRARAEEREWLITNGLGSYGSGTVAGTRTRAYHGLLMAALRAPADPCERTLLVAALEEEVVVAGRTIPLAHPWIVSFALEGTVPTWRYALGDVLLEKRLWMQPRAHTTTVLYRLLQASAPVQLCLTALVNSRSHHGGIPRPEITLAAVPRGVRMVPQDTGALPFVVLSDRGTTTLASPGEWCGGVALPAEEERGLPSRDDHLRACRITALLGPEAPTLTVVASTEREPPLDGEGALRERHVHVAGLLDQWRQAQPELAGSAPPWVNQLVLAADQFVVARSCPGEGQREEGQTIMAGYPWFGDWGRDTMISLPGLTLTTGRAPIAAQILRTYGRFISQGMLPNRFPEGRETLGEHDYNTVDATLWYVEALRQYHQATGDGALIRELFPKLREIVEAHCGGTRHGIRRDPADGLLRAGEEGLQLTWMDAKVNGEVITPRIGKPVEVNALWCCALRTMVGFAALYGEPGGPYAELAEAARRGFQRFWNQATGYCFDVLDGPDGSPEEALRPNQLLAVALTNGLLSKQQARQVVAVCGQQLLTPVGLRSLDPRHPAYQGHYGGGPLARDRAYHQGTVWSWWLGPYALAHGRVHGDPVGALRLLEAVAPHLATAGVGSISEIFDGDAPHWARGCIAQAWSVAEVLRAWVELKGMG
jgi:predicted glycogen debranching enzyme